MGLVGELQDKLQALDPTVDGVVARSYPRQQNDRRFFYVYASGRPRYIASLPRNPQEGNTRMIAEEATMNRIEARLGGSPVRDAILRPSLTLTTKFGVFAVADYVEPARRVQTSRPPGENALSLLDRSSEWLLEFQSATLVSSPPNEIEESEPVSDRLDLWTKHHASILTADFLRLKEEFLTALTAVKKPLPQAACHGDYFFGNYFFDAADCFRVYDWEFASERESVARDYLGNLILYVLAYARTATRPWHVTELFDRDGDSGALATRLAEKLQVFQCNYHVEKTILPVHMAQAYFSQILRCTSEANIKMKANHAAEFSALLSQNSLV